MGVGRTLSLAGTLGQGEDFLQLDEKDWETPVTTWCSDGSWGEFFVMDEEVLISSIQYYMREWVERIGRMV